MSDNSKDNEIPKWQQVLLLVGVVMIALLTIFIGNKFFPSSDSDAANYSTCETRFDPTSCPEPEYETWIEDTSKQYPDDSY